MTLTFGSLFAGIGGIDLGLERAGMKCCWQVEIDDYARKILAKHWPDVPRYTDVRGFLGGKRWRSVRSAWAVDCIAGGFPCQDVSNAGRRAGIDGKRSGLWSEFARIVHLLRPRHVLVENVPALTIRGLGRVLGDLAKLGYDCEWDRIPAAAVGAPHLRWRIFIVADATSNRRQQGWMHHGGEGARGRHVDRGAVEKAAPDADHCGSDDQLCSGRQIAGRGSEEAADAHSERSQIGRCIGRDAREEQQAAERSRREDLPYPASRWSGQRWRKQFAAFCESQRDLYWPEPEPWVRGVDDGSANRFHGSGGINANESGNTKGDSEASFVAWKILRKMWEKRSLAATSPRLFDDAMRDSLHFLPSESGSRGWFSPTKASQELQDLWDVFYSKPFKESRDLLGTLLIGIGKEECDEKMVGAQSRQDLRDVRSGFQGEAVAGHNVQSIMREQISLAEANYLRPTADGVANRVDRLRCLGNAVVPQIAEYIGRQIIETEALQ